MQRAADGLHGWLDRLPRERTPPQKAAAVEALRSSVQEYLARASGPASAADAQAALSRAVAAAEALSEQNFRDAQRAIAEAQRWRSVANAAGVGSGLLLLGGLATLLWAARRQLLRPLEDFRHALHGFSPTGPVRSVPEAGPAELREISSAFNVLAARLAREREAQLSFLAGVAHDLRNPLSALKATAHLMSPQRALPPEDKVREKFALVGRQADRLARMVEDLLDTTRVEAGQLALQVREHDLAELVQEAVELHRDVSERHALLLVLPEGPLRVRCDATRVSQVLNNLLSNAIKYSPGGGSVQVRLSMEPQGEPGAGAAQWARVDVQDAGVGIPEAEHESIFEPFRRARASRESIPGVGLGLSVARRIALAHGGSISLRSAPGEGSTFTLRLPLGPAAPAAS
ncbi:HAMP domain-containing histidine kinase [Aggregicoccus sp. 17bor-14]|nr:HAMP domain-containing histidine kinase [Simulacricoccus sp. 17bor-14]MRI92206.1 HAMP domain-containing histidine kinase [Aggregicoccus sp. 17bor-14]